MQNLNAIKTYLENKVIRYKMQFNREDSGPLKAKYKDILEEAEDSLNFVLGEIWATEKEKNEYKELEKIITKHEGEKLFPYRCTADKLTIAMGRNLSDVGISKEEARFMLLNDIKAVITDLKKIFPNWSTMTKNRQNALADLRFQLGPSGFRGFEKMIKAILVDDWATAKKQYLDSKYAREDTPNRALWAANTLLRG